MPNESDILYMPMRRDDLQTINRIFATMDTLTNGRIRTDESSFNRVHNIAYALLKQRRGEPLKLALQTLLDCWRVGSGDWTWAEELIVLRGTPDHGSRTNALIEDIKERGIQTPILLGTDGRVWDGHHRVIAAMILGLENVPVEFAWEERSDNTPHAIASRRRKVDNAAQVIFEKLRKNTTVPDMPDILVYTCARALVDTTEQIWKDKNDDE